MRPKACNPKATRGILRFLPLCCGGGQSRSWVEIKGKEGDGWGEFLRTGDWPGLLLEARPPGHFYFLQGRIFLFQNCRSRLLCSCPYDDQKVRKMKLNNIWSFVKKKNFRRKLFFCFVFVAENFLHVWCGFFAFEFELCINFIFC